jgi:hypothetical protein
MNLALDFVWCELYTGRPMPDEILRFAQDWGARFDAAQTPQLLQSYF